MIARSCSKQTALSQFRRCNSQGGVTSEHCARSRRFHSRERCRNARCPKPAICRFHYSDHDSGSGARAGPGLRAEPVVSEGVPRNSHRCCTRDRRLDSRIWQGAREARAPFLLDSCTWRTPRITNGCLRTIAGRRAGRVRQGRAPIPGCSVGAASSFWPGYIVCWPELVLM